MISARGVTFSARVSLLTLVAIMACIAISLGCLLMPTYDHKSGHTVLSSRTWHDNEWPQFSNSTSAFPSLNGVDSSIMLMFVLVFPGFTGVLAGAASG